MTKALPLGQGDLTGDTSGMGAAYEGLFVFASAGEDVESGFVLKMQHCDTSDGTFEDVVTFPATTENNEGLELSAKNAVLSEFSWSFALRLRPLVPSAVSAPPGWLYTFTWPAGAAALYNVYAEDMTKAEFIVQDGVICALRSALNAEYTAIDVSFNSWPAPAAEAFAARLASDAAAALTGSQQLAISLLEKYGLLIGMAKQNSVNEANMNRIAPAHYMNVRD